EFGARSSESLAPATPNSFRALWCTCFGNLLWFSHGEHVILSDGGSMKKLTLILMLGALLFWVDTVRAQTELNPPKPPVAKKVPKRDTVHSDVRVDDYYWLREKTNPEVIAYLEAENAYTEAMMKSSEPFQASLYHEMLARIKQTDLTVPYRE